MKCHQRIMKEQRLSEDLASLSFDPRQCSIDEYIFAKEPFSDEIRKFLQIYEWLQTVGVSPKWCFTMRLKSYLAGLQILNEPAAYSKILGPDTMKWECLIQRGCTISWAHPHLGSRMLMMSLRWMVQNTAKRLFVGYADPGAREVGIIYQATNFKYLGNKFGSIYRFRHPTYKKNKEFCVHSLRRTSVFKSWCRANNIKVESSFIKSNGFKDLSVIPEDIKKAWYAWGNRIVSESERIEIPSKGKYALVLGKDRKEQRYLESLFKIKTFSYPKRLD